MAAWVSKIRVVCPAGVRVAKLIGSSYDDALKKGLQLDPGPGCKKVSFSVVQRGVGAGQRDRREGERLDGFRLKDLWPFKKAPAKRHPMSRTVYIMKTKSGSYVPVDRPPNSVMAGAKRRKRRR
jgi:hypothetical protein